MSDPSSGDEPPCSTLPGVVVACFNTPRVLLALYAAFSFPPCVASRRSSTIGSSTQFGFVPARVSRSRSASRRRLAVTDRRCGNLPLDGSQIDFVVGDRRRTGGRSSPTPCCTAAGRMSGSTACGSRPSARRSRGGFGAVRFLALLLVASVVGALVQSRLPTGELRHPVIGASAGSPARWGRRCASCSGPRARPTPCSTGDGSRPSFAAGADARRSWCGPRRRCSSSWCGSARIWCSASIPA